MSDLLREILNENSTPIMNCRVREMFDTVPPEDRKALMSAIDNHEITAPAIERALKKNGYFIAGTTIRRHRRGECSCAKLS